MFQPEHLTRHEPSCGLPEVGRRCGTLFCACAAGDPETVERLVGRNPSLVRSRAQCSTCGPALEAAAALTANLAALPQPAPPPDVTAAVLARITQIDRAHSAPVAAATMTRSRVGGGPPLDVARRLFVPESLQSAARAPTVAPSPTRHEADGRHASTSAHCFDGGRPRWSFRNELSSQLTVTRLAHEQRPSTAEILFLLIGVVRRQRSCGFSTDVSPPAA